MGIQTNEIDIEALIVLATFDFSENKKIHFTDDLHKKTEKLEGKSSYS